MKLIVLMVTGLFFNLRLCPFYLVNLKINFTKV